MPLGAGLYSVSMGLGIGIDIGGTFIDVVVADDRGLRVMKLPSDDASPAGRIIPSLIALAGGGTYPQGIDRVAHGTTVATNALLEGDWGRTALITTAGLADVLSIGRQNRSRLYDLNFRRPPAVIPRSLRFEAKERVLADGTVHVALSDEEISRVVAAVERAGAEAIAVCFLFSFLRPEHERRMGAALSRALKPPVTLSSELLPEFREYERTSTTAVNAALMPVVGRYLTDLEAASRGANVACAWEIMQSSGAMIPAELAQRQPARILLSGPAAGVEAACFVGAALGCDDLVSLDMGGTSCDVSLIRRGTVSKTTRSTVGGYAVALPMVDVHTIGAGGGSIAWVDSGGALRIGPRSAGAVPGPCCYNRGGDEPTVTDAHVVLGRIPAEHSLGGLGTLDRKAARAAIGRIAHDLGLDVQAAALGILRVANAAMERAIRTVSVERGHDPREYALIAYGGAGPLHAVDLARRLEIPRVILPGNAGVLSAMGLLGADTAFDVSQGVLRPLDGVTPGDLLAVIRGLWRNGSRTLSGRGPRGNVGYRLDVDLRYRGQSHELTVPLASDLGAPVLDESAGSALLDEAARAFHDAHERRFGHADMQRPVELVAVRLRVVLAGTGWDIATLGAPPGANERSPGTSEIANVGFLDDGWREAQVVHRAQLAPGTRLRGPMLLLSEESTAVLPPGCDGTVEINGHVVLDVHVG